MADEKIMRKDKHGTSFHYDSRERAENSRKWRIKELNMADDVLVVVGDGGTPERFAIIGRHQAAPYGIKVEMPKITKGGRVKDKTRLGITGIVKEAGPEVSVVTWDNGRTEAIPNYYLQPKQALARVKSTRC
jgi:hypothetical protein